MATRQLGRIVGVVNTRSAVCASAMRQLERAVFLAPCSPRVRALASELSRKMQLPPLFVATLIQDAELAAPLRRSRRSKVGRPCDADVFRLLPAELVQHIVAQSDFDAARALASTCSGLRTAVRAAREVRLPTVVDWHDAVALAGGAFDAVGTVVLAAYAGGEQDVVLDLSIARRRARLGLCLHGADLCGDVRAGLVLGALWATSRAYLRGADASYSFEELRGCNAYENIPLYEPVLLAACVGALSRNARRPTFERVRWEMEVFGVTARFHQLRRALRQACTAPAALAA